MKTNFKSIGFCSLFVVFTYLFIPSVSAQWLGTGNIYYNNGNVGIGTRDKVFTSKFVVAEGEEAMSIEYYDITIITIL